MGRRRRRTKSNPGNRLVSLTVLLAFAGLALWLRQHEGQNGTGGGGRVAGAPPVGHGPGYQTLSGCRLVPTRSNDGDSFRVAHGGGEVTLRLYFVDAPESYVNPRGYNVDRIADQGRYFGGLTQGDTVAVGVAAKEFTTGLLGSVEFEAITGWEPVFDSERRYGFVRITGGEHSGRYLSELLVERGLARIHTKGSDPPDGRSQREFEGALRSLEKGARGRRAGAWARNS